MAHPQARRHQRGVERAPPIHSMLIVCPSAALVGTLLTDLTYWRTGDPFWASVSACLVGAGVVAGAVAADAVVPWGRVLSAAIADILPLTGGTAASVQLGTLSA